MTASPAIALLEFDSVSTGTWVADAMVKRAPIESIQIGTVQPGKYLILVGGPVAVVEEAYIEACRLTGGAHSDRVFIPNVHEQVAASLDGKRRTNDGDALGILETSGIPTNVLAADTAIKAADVSIVEIRLGDGLGGKGITHLCGRLEDVQAAMEAGGASITDPGLTHQSIIIPAQHADVRKRVGQTSYFRS